MPSPYYFYEDFIANSNSVVFNVEPYQHYDYIYKHRHFVECWCDLLGIECDSIYPEVFFSDTEKELAETYVKGFPKPLVLCQFEGGKIPQDRSTKQKLINKSAMYRRSLPQEVQQKVVDDLNVKGYSVGVVAHENQFVPGCSDRVFMPIRAILAIIPYVKGIIGIDSLLMHGTAIYQRKSVICWSGTNPKVLGYDFNVNLRREVCPTPECHRPNSYLLDIEPNNFQWECPHNDRCCDYSPKEIGEALDNLLKGEEENVEDDRERAESLNDFGQENIIEEEGGIKESERRVDSAV
jgi:hypothetical protein